MLNTIMKEAAEAGRLDRKDRSECAPYHSARYKALRQKYPEKHERKMLKAYLDAHRGYVLDVSKLPPLFNRH